jgi:hypothetical protein
MPSQQTPATTTQIQKVELPAWVDAASQQNYAQAQQTSNNLTPTAPQNVADQTVLQGQAVDMLNQSSGMSSGTFGNALNAIGGAKDVAYNPVALWGGARDVSAPTDPGNVTAKGFLDRDITAYMNPYTQQVIDATDQASRRDEALSLMKNSDANRASGSYGGSRDAITNAVLQSEGVRNRAQTDAGLRSAGFTDAANRIQADNALDLTAQTSNQNKGLTLNSQRIQQEGMNQNADIAKGQLNANIGMHNSDQDLNAQEFNVGTAFNRANAYTGLGSAIASAGNAQSLLAANLGQAQQANAQANMDAQTANATLGNTDAANALNMKLAALGMSPYGKTTTSNSVSQGGQSSNPLMSILGGGLSLGSMLFGGSDRTIKKNVKRVGKVEGTDLNKYEFEYKKGFMGAPMGKQVGLMAQDVERKVPGAVSRRQDSNGKSYKAVDYGRALSHGFMGN